MVTANSILSVTTPIAVHNLHGPDKNVSHRHGSILALLNAGQGGLGAFNEFNSKDLSFLKAEAKKRGLGVQVVGLNGVVYDLNHYHIGKPRVKKIMQGGHVGADGVATSRKGDDDRRVGPSRYGLYFPATVLDIDLDFEFDVTHMMARAFSVHKWRQKLFWKSVGALADGVVEPNGIMTGDFNANPRVDLPGIAEVNVPADADMGRQHYTKVMRWGKRIFISAMKDLNTPSDHDLLKGMVTFYSTDQAHLEPAPVSPTPDKPVVHPKLPKPGAKVRWKKYGAPVAHPWSKRYDTPRFKRRRPALYSRIHKWRSAYRRRL